MIPGSSSLYAMLNKWKVSGKNATIESDDVVLDVAEEPAFSLSIDRRIGSIFLLFRFP